MNLIQNPYYTTHVAFFMLLHYLGKIKIQTFCKYSEDIEENVNELYLRIDFNSPTRVTAHAECIYVLAEYLKY